MSDRIEREQWLAATPEEVWDTVTGDGWLADRVTLDLGPGGDARFESGGSVRTGWVEDVRAPERLSFWWAAGEEPAS
ncbi:MAG: SRPBCC domain-containing protein, partial [Solirubrobacterales bacterium]|nr:SRPBCC domain-containing protein [Solirubrobacterales bacterium]